MQPDYVPVRPPIRWSSQTVFLSNCALRAMPKQEQQCLHVFNTDALLFALMPVKMQQYVFKNHYFPLQACNRPTQPFLRRLESWTSKTQKSMWTHLPGRRSFEPAELLSSIFPTLVRILKSRTKNLQVSHWNSNSYRWEVKTGVTAWSRIYMFTPIITQLWVGLIEFRSLRCIVRTEFSS